MTDADRDDTRGDAPDDAPVGPVTLTTGRIAGDAVDAVDAVDALAAALGAAGVAVERRVFLPARDDETPPWGALLLAVAGPPLPLAQLVAPATAPPGVVPALAAALGIGPNTDQAPTTDPQTDPATAPATLQLKAEGVFVVVRVRDRDDLMRVLDGLPAQVARLTVRGAERRLVYETGSWQIDP